MKGSVNSLNYQFQKRKFGKILEPVSESQGFLLGILDEFQVIKKKDDFQKKKNE